MLDPKLRKDRAIWRISNVCLDSSGGYDDSRRGCTETDGGGLFEDVFDEGPVQFGHWDGDDKPPACDANNEHERSNDGDKSEPETYFTKPVTRRVVFGCIE